MSSSLRDTYEGRTVLVTGHTGFKGAWLSTWLKGLGARVVGLSLAPEPDEPSLFEAAHVAECMVSVIADVRDLTTLHEVVRAHAPEIVFHLAAQSLVLRSYAEPVETYATNVMGTVHVLEAVRQAPCTRAVVVVTSDKCYENRGSGHGYHEADPMGGHDPYSSSKGCAELVTAAYRRSFFGSSGPAVASARAGNVIGGGDWARDRLVPDIVRGALRGEPVTIRHPNAVRPWQHVLDPLLGYLMLGRSLLIEGRAFAEGWNFGPDEADAASVADVVARLQSHWDRVRIAKTDPAPDLHEARLLTLDSTKASHRLGWKPRLNLDDAVAWTIDWYRRCSEDPGSAAALLSAQLRDYERRIPAKRGT